MASLIKCDRCRQPDRTPFSDSQQIGRKMCVLSRCTTIILIMQNKELNAFMLLNLYVFMLVWGGLTGSWGGVTL